MMNDTNTLDSSLTVTAAKPPYRTRLVAALTRLYPLYSGRGWLANHPAVRRLAGNPTELMWAKVDGGHVLADPQEHIGRAAIYCGDLDPKVSWMLKQLVRPGHVALDIGANIGLMTLLLARLTGSEGTVIAWEPQPLLRARLSVAVAASGYSHVRSREAALGDHIGPGVLCVPTHNQGMGSLVRHRDHAHMREVPVEITTLDANLQLPHVDFIKIDVEGHEAAVLRGAYHTIRRYRPLIALENNGEDVRALEILASHGYRLLYAPRCYVRMRLVRFRGQRDANDFLAVPQERWDSIASLVGA